MDVEDALKANEMLKAKIIVPMHYNTFPLIKADPNELKKRSEARVEIFRIGETKEL